MRFTFITVLGFLLWGNLWAQSGATEIYGKVIDANTKQPLEYVNIHLVGTPKADLTDPKGDYRVRTIERVDSISFSYLGYKTRTVPIKRGKVQELNIEMGSGDVVLKEVTVKAGKKRKKRVIDTTANYVFYKVLLNKDHNRADAAESYTYESYEKLLHSIINPQAKFLTWKIFNPFRFAFKNEDTTESGSVFIPGVIKESVSDVYYRRDPKAYKQYVRGETLSGIDNESVINFINYHFSAIDAYDNIYIIAATPFTAPFAPTGLGTYYYYLTDTALIDGRTSYKLHFVGKVKEDLALKGFAWIDSATWGIRSIDFRPNEKANFNFVNDYTVKQDFLLQDEKYWVMQREEVNTIASLFKKKNKLGILVTKILNRKNIQTNVWIPDSIFAGPDERILLDSARYRNRKFWDTTRFEPLTSQESRVYGISDSIKLVPAWKTYMFLGRLFTSAYADAGPISIGRVLNFVSRNNVEGWRVRFGFETNPRFMPRGTPVNNFFRTFYYAGYVAYGFKDHDYKYLSMIRINLPRKNDRWQSLEAMYRYDMRVPGQDPDQSLLTFDNFTTIISGTILRKIMKTREFRIAYEKEFIKGFSAIASMTEKTFFDVPGVFDFSRQTDMGIQHLPKFNVTEFTIDTRYSYKTLYFVNNFFRYFQTTKYPVFMLRYTAGVVDMQPSYFNYHELFLTIRQRLYSKIGYTNYIFRAGKIFGKAPYTVCYLTQGNLGVLLDKFNYNLLREFEFVSDQSASLWIEHNFNGFFFNKIPGFNRLRLREVLTFKSLIGTFNKKNAEALQVPAELGHPFPVPYIEMGFGIANIAYLFRVDVLWRVTYRNEPGAPNWAIKFALQPGF